MQNQKWIWLYTVCFLDLFGASMIMPVFTSHLRSLGISHVNIGLLSSLYGVTQLISGPIIGSWSDVHGRQSILCISIMVSAAAYGLMGAISSFYLFIIVRLVLGSFKHTQTLCRAYISDLVPQHRQAHVLGLINAITSFSFMLGPVISGHVMEIEGGFQYLSGSVLLIFVLNSTVVHIFAGSEDVQRKIDMNENNTFNKKIVLVFKELVSIEWNRYWAYFSIKFLFGLAGFLFFQNLGVILTEHFKITPRNVGYTISFYGFISGICNLGTGRIRSFRFMPKNNLERMTYMFAVMAITFFLMYIADSYILFIVGIVPLASSHALTRIFMTEVLLEQSDSRSRGSMVGVSSSIAAIARIISPFISGVIISRISVHGALAASTIIATITCVLNMVYSHQTHVIKH